MLLGSSTPKPFTRPPVPRYRTRLLCQVVTCRAFERFSQFFSFSVSNFYVNRAVDCAMILSIWNLDIEGRSRTTAV
ncbi:Hypothetical protein NTJ_00757 [Nesidiocoris tenuis]|uniref:Uncharacterized protein n=1 Tax=Nesidiocoris tenuis TaxID=355587 RepID=A0ABN7A742_9HEMI|nr:Hypothetical protein NTJ_00757 [Nesidiocoris tenuis]